MQLLFDVMTCAWEAILSQKRSINQSEAIKKTQLINILRQGCELQGDVPLHLQLRATSSLSGSLLRQSAAGTTEKV
jgi:hypothetical protein